MSNVFLTQKADRSWFCHTYPPNHLFSRHVGMPWLSIPVILWGLRTVEAHVDHMREEDFLKAEQGENVTEH